MISEDVRYRLLNYKFEQARRLALRDPEIDALTEHERGVIEALAALFGNPGWFDGQMSVLVDAAIQNLIRGDGDVQRLSDQPLGTEERGGGFTDQ